MCSCQAKNGMQINKPAADFPYQVWSEDKQKADESQNKIAQAYSLGRK
jgi:hypothetical protein